MEPLHMSCCRQLTSALVGSEAVEGSPCVAQLASPPVHCPFVPFFLSYFFHLSPFTECPSCALF